MNDGVRLRQVSLEKESLNHSLFELAPSGVVMVDEDGRILEFNEQAHRQLGYTSEEFASLHIADFDADDRQVDVRTRISRIFDTGGAEFDARHRAKSGEIRQMLVRARPVEIDGKRRVVLVSQDITDRKRAEETLRESEERYRAVFENSPLPKWLYDVETLRFLAVNDAAVRHYGYTREEFLKMTIKDLRLPEDVDGLLKALPTTALGLAHHGSWRHRKKDGTPIDVQISSHAFMLRERTTRLVAVRDVTDTRREEESRARLTAELERELAERKRMEKELLERVDMAALSADVGMAAAQEETLRAMLQRCAEAIVRRLGA